MFFLQHLRAADTLRLDRFLLMDCAYDWILCNYVLNYCLHPIVERDDDENNRLQTQCEQSSSVITNCFHSSPTVIMTFLPTDHQKRREHIKNQFICKEEEKNLKCEMCNYLSNDEMSFVALQLYKNTPVFVFINKIRRKIKKIIPP